MDSKINQLQILPTSKNYPHEPLWFYICDNELFHTSFYDARYNEYAIFIYYHEWYVSGSIPFYQYLKIVNAYRSLLQDLNQHLVLIVAPTRYVETLRYHQDYFEYWKSFEPHILQFIQKIIPDVHTFPHDYLSFQTHYLSPTTTIKVIQTFHTSCLQFSREGFHCNLLQQFTSHNQGSRAFSLSLPHFLLFLPILTSCPYP